MDSLLVDHLKEQSLRVFLAIRVDFNSGQTLALIDGASTVRFTVDGETAVFRGNDPIYGSLAAADTVSERILEEAPRFKFTLNPTGPDGLGELSAPINQGSPVRVWYGSIDDAGTVIGQPELLWAGALDTVKINSTENMFTAEVDSASAFERLFVDQESVRLNGKWHKGIWPDETGLDYVYDTEGTIYWGGVATGLPENATKGGNGGGGTKGGNGVKNVVQY